MPVLLVANKIDLDPSRARKKYAFVEERLKERNGDFPVFFCSASDGTNVVKAFEESIKRAMMFQTKGDKEDLSNEVLRFIHEESIREGGMFNNDREQSELDFE